MNAQTIALDVSTCLRKTPIPDPSAVPCTQAGLCSDAFLFNLVFGSPVLYPRRWSKASSSTVLALGNSFLPLPYPYLCFGDFRVPLVDYCDLFPDRALLLWKAGSWFSPQEGIQGHTE